MKKILRKMLFTTLLFSVTVPSEMQANLSNWIGFENMINLLSRDSGSFFNFLKKLPVMVGGVGTTFVLILSILKVNEKEILTQAAYHGHTGIVRLILKMGADINTQGLNGNTPLRWALTLERPSQEIIRLLLDHGADFNKPNNQGRTPWKLTSNKPIIREIIKNCVSQRQTEITEALMKARKELTEDPAKLIASFVEEIPQEDE